MDKSAAESWEELHEAVGEFKKAVIEAPLWWKIVVSVMLYIGFVLFLTW